MGGSFLAPGPPKLTFVESKGCQFLFILSMGQDCVFQKILTSPISLMNIFLGHPVCNYEFPTFIEMLILFFINICKCKIAGFHSRNIIKLQQLRY